jgi:hypothetical protein
MAIKLLEVVAEGNSSDAPSLVDKVTATVKKFLDETGAKQTGLSLEGTTLDPQSVKRPQSVFGRTIVVLVHEGGSSKKSDK